MGTAQRSRRAHGGHSELPPLLPGCAGQPGVHRCHLLQSLGTKSLQRGRQSQPGPSIRPAGRPAPRPERLRPEGTVPPAGPEPCGAGQGDRGCQGQWLGHTMTHRQGHLLHQWLPAPPTAGRQPGLPGVRGCWQPPGSPSPTSPSPPRPQQCGRDQWKRTNHHPPKPPQRPPPRCRVIGLPVPRTGSSTGWGRAGGLPAAHCPRLFLPVPPRGSLGGGSTAVAGLWVPPASPAVSGALGWAPATGLAQAGRGDRHPRRYRAQPVLSFSSSIGFLFLFSFPLGNPEPGPGSCHRHHHDGLPPSLSPGRGDGAVAQPPRAAVTRRSLLLWPGPSAPCPCPAVRLSCSPCPGRLRRARGRALRSPPSGRSS